MAFREFVCNLGVDFNIIGNTMKLFSYAKQSENKTLFSKESNTFLLY